ncbi:uncharacterized membrane protein (DUF485 family) [Arthrobacter stackebrandtii]|uniref:Uncharacterized membrane protein (DUF485 family) n=1 Tax=Arthrobacter stackebrandtii TaxID=272161 RepID=A0ABS4YRC3_9MICC|nr:DUF485 domain-containing protein [Arthrobacter stackebrandtii]MBP2411340.1 uncharacterized membrane protein (DUF485 family) [Arthrobacter stackebrandtii]PYH00164.1 DUF485 domain-containing protein [Arthrobacter stackebrandtii]
MGNSAHENAAGPVDFVAEQNSEEFQKLKKSHRSFVLPVAAGFLLWYFAYVLLAAYAHDFMSIKVWGSINIGLIMGLLQFVTTFGITAWYVSYANRKLDPQATVIRQRLEAQIDAANLTKEEV